MWTTSPTRWDPLASFVYDIEPTDGTERSPRCRVARADGAYPPFLPRRTMTYLFFSSTGGPHWCLRSGTPSAGSTCESSADSFVPVLNSIGGGMFDDMMHRGLWFAPTWPMMQSRLSDIIWASNQSMEVGYGMGTVDVLPTRCPALTLPLQSARWEPGGWRLVLICAERDDHPRPTTHNMQHLPFAIMLP